MDKKETNDSSPKLYDGSTPYQGYLAESESGNSRYTNSIALLYKKTPPFSHKGNGGATTIH